MFYIKYMINDSIDKSKDDPDWWGGLPCGSAVKNPHAYRSCKRCKSYPWVWKFPWRRTWHPTLVFLPGESHRQEEASGLQSMGSQLDMTEAASQARTTWWSMCVLTYTMRLKKLNPLLRHSVGPSVEFFPKNYPSLVGPYHLDFVLLFFCSPQLIHSFWAELVDILKLKILDKPNVV